MAVVERQGVDDGEALADGADEDAVFVEGDAAREDGDAVGEGCVAVAGVEGELVLNFEEGAGFARLDAGGGSSS